MSDEGEFWRDVREAGRQCRQRNRLYSPTILAERGIHFEVKNGGAHLIVTGRDCLIDFWPGTGKYIARDGRKGRGVRNLMKLCEPPEAGHDEQD